MCHGETLKELPVRFPLRFELSESVRSKRLDCKRSQGVFSIAAAWRFERAVSVPFRRFHADGACRYVNYCLRPFRGKQL